MIRRVLIGAAVTAAGQEALLRVTRGRGRWERRNYRNRPVNLAGGVGAALGATAVAADAPPGVRAAALLATAAAGSIGAADDLDPTPSAARGLRGHLRALARGQVTTGAMKLLGISSASLLAAAVLDPAAADPTAQPRTRGVGRGADILAKGALIAGTANLINLFDLRPGRALKVAGALAGVQVASRANPLGAHLADGILGVCIAAALRDLREETMLGDTGANSLGALAGVALATHPDRRVTYACLIAVTGLILASEKVSFSRVITRNRLLHAVDSWGRTR